MSFKEWLCLWLLFLGYLFFGAAVFYQIERPSEQEKMIELAEQRMQLQNLLQSHFHFSSLQSQQQVLNALNNLCGQDIFDFQIKRNLQPGEVIEEGLEEDELTFKWTYYNSFFFALTTLSTIGYGNLHPSSPLSRFLVIIYSLIGIPINGIVLTQLGEFFGSTFLRAHHRYKSTNTEFQSKLGIVMDIFMYLAQGIVIFIIFPSGMFVYFEGWTFNESIYYAFVTLTTIGYGDFVAGQLPKNKDYYSLYKVALVVWIMFGLGYLVMILGFISRAMRSKKLARLEHRLTHNIKLARSKLWHELTEEIAYVRRTLNEMYLLKFKPVYRDPRDEADGLLGRMKRSQSAPNLSEWPVMWKVKKETPPVSDNDEDVEEEFKKVRMRRRAGLSENLMKPKVLKVRSDGDLFKIDLNATFEAPSNIAPSELLARVVDALGTTGGMSDSSDDEDTTEDGFLNRNYFSITKGTGRMQGVDGFSDEEILASEQYGSTEGPGVKRSRALSDTAPPLSPLQQPSSYVEQWTWAGAAATERMQKLRRQRDMIRRSGNISRHPDPSKVDVEKGLPLPVRGLRRMSQAAYNFISTSSSKTHRWFQNLKTTDSKKAKRKSHLSQSCHRLSVPESRYDDEYRSQLPRHYYTHTQATRPPSEFLTALAATMAAGNHGQFPMHSPVLEQTTVAEFMTVLNALHTRVGTQLANVGNINIRTVHAPEKKRSPLFTLFKHASQDENMFPLPSSDSKPPRESRRMSTAGYTTAAPPAPQGQTPTQQPPSEKKPRRFSLSPFSLSCYPKKDSTEKPNWLQRKSSSPGLTSSNPSISMPQFMKIRRRTLSTSSSVHPITCAPTVMKTRTPVVPHPPVPPPATTTALPQITTTQAPPTEGKTKRRLSARPPSGGGQKIKRFSVSPCEEQAICLTMTSTTSSVTSSVTPAPWRPPDEGQGQTQGQATTRLFTMIPPEEFGSGRPPGSTDQSDPQKADLESVVVDKL
ncbi:uncharacterized protein Ork1 isoform X1 [Bemisia tabaci]|uniref:uncharacterized protein Ork1 isoform X1 n=2 Tax=Bemisia tabaci TaxID=7038 RepID=UPI003B27F922